MQTHEETVKQARQVKADKVSAAKSTSGIDSDLAGAAREIEGVSGPVANGEATEVEKEESAGEGQERINSGLIAESKGNGREDEVERKRDEIKVEEKPDIASSTNTATTTNITPPQSHSSILLHPILSHPYLPAPIKLYIHLVRLLLIPASTLRAQGLPDKLDTILLMDTLIWVVGILVVVVVGGKVGRKLGKVFKWGSDGARSGMKAGGAVVVAGARAGGPGVVAAAAAAAAAGQANIRRPRHLNPDQAAQNTHVHLRRYGGQPARGQGQQQGGVGNPQQHHAAGAIAAGEPGGANPTQEPGLAGPPTTTTGAGTRGDEGLSGPRDDPAAVRRARAVAEERTQGI